MSGLAKHILTCLPRDGNHMPACDVHVTRQTNINFSARQSHHMTAAIFVCLAMSHIRSDWHS